MRFLNKAVAVGAGVVAAVGGAVVTATPAAAADGYLYAWDLIDKGGAYCLWQGDDSNWNTCTDRDGSRRDLRNRASSVHNNGFSHAVNFYFSPTNERQSAWACLSRGDYWPNLSVRTFTRGHGLPGHGATVNNNIAAHKWLPAC